jgi:hypothetical protein
MHAHYMWGDPGAVEQSPLNSATVCIQLILLHVCGCVQCYSISDLLYSANENFIARMLDSEYVLMPSIVGVKSVAVRWY